MSVTVATFYFSQPQVPYGRYSNSNGSGWGPKIPARVAWIVMESPTLIIMSLLFFHFGSKDAIQSRSNQFLISFFVIHYLNRAVIYPFRMSQSAPMPITVLLIAWLYVVWNSFTQAIALTRVLTYPSVSSSLPPSVSPHRSSSSSSQ
jgi:3-oxo-5-alpha-steroid 4-dehydrogenase 1